MDDSKIIELFFDRSEQAISELMLKYEKAARRIAFHVLNDAKDVEECLNDTWLQVWNSIPPARPSSLHAYVFKIVKNISLNRYHANVAKKRNSFYDLALDELEGDVPALETVETKFDAQELAAQLSQFLKNLSYKDRYLFTRRYWYGDPVSEIAEQSDLSTNAVSIRLYRIRKQLQKYLQREGVIE